MRHPFIEGDLYPVRRQERGAYSCRRPFQAARCGRSHQPCGGCRGTPSPSHAGSLESWPRVVKQAPLGEAPAPTCWRYTTKSALPFGHHSPRRVTTALPSADRAQRVPAIPMCCVVPIAGPQATWSRRRPDGSRPGTGGRVLPACASHRHQCCVPSGAGFLHLRIP